MTQQRDPHRFREESFRRYEQIILKVQKAFPTAVKFKPQNFSCETVASRLRDAVRAVLSHSEWETQVDRKWLNEFWPDLEVSHDGEFVTVRKKGQRGVKVVTTMDTVATSSTLRLVLNDPTEQLVHACCLLIDAGVVKEPVLINNMDGALHCACHNQIASNFPDLILSPQDTPPNSYLLV